MCSSSQNLPTCASSTAPVASQNSGRAALPAMMEARANLLGDGSARLSLRNSSPVLKLIDDGRFCSYAPHS